MTAAAIAEVVAKLRLYRTNVGDGPVEDLVDAVIEETLESKIVVDATPIYEMILNQTVNLYEDHPCVSPPWQAALVTYTNHFGHVHLMPMVAFDLVEEPSKVAVALMWEPEDNNPFNWDDVRWIVLAVMHVGGRHEGRPFKIKGPLVLYELAVGADGTPIDVHYVAVGIDLGVTLEVINDNMTDVCVLMGVLNFMNCRNVDIAEPMRPRSERRRLERLGVRVSEINVFPTGKKARYAPSGRRLDAVPLTMVRGHFAEYGPQYGKGLLFGRYEGRFWIPQHVYGQGEELGGVIYNPVTKAPE